MRKASVVLIAILAACGHDGTAANGDDDVPGDGGPGDTDGGSNSQGATTVKLTMNHRPQNGAQHSFIVAYRDGAGPWTLSDPPQGDEYAFQIYAPVYSIMWSCIGASSQNSTIRQVSILSFAIGDRTSLAVDVPPRCSDPQGLVTLHGQVANGNLLDSYVVRWGDRQAAVNNGQYTMQVPPGTHDLVLLEASTITIGDPQPAAAFVKRAVAVTAATQVDLDAGDVEDLQTFEVSDSKAVTTLYANGTVAPLAAQTIASLAADQMAAGDVYDLQLSVTSGSAVATRTFATDQPGDLAWVDVPALGTVTTAVAATQPYPQLASTWAMYPEASGYTWAAAQTATNGQGSAQVVWTAQLSASVLGTTPSFEMPDFSQLAGWNPALQLVAGKAVAGGVQAQISSVMGDFPPALPPALGTRRTMASTTFAISP